MDENRPSRGHGGSVPDWAWFFEPDQVARFLECVEDALGEFEVEYELHPGEGIVELRSEEDGARMLGLGNLAQHCRRLDVENWPRDIARHIEQLLLLPEREGDLLERLGEDFELARSHLRIRLFAEGLPNEDRLILRRPMKGVLAVLVYDLPEAIATVPRDHATQWGRFDDELFEIAMARVRDEPPDRESVEIEDGVEATVLAGPSYYCSTHALLLDEYLTKGAGRGALVSIPHWHLVIFHEILDETVIVALNGIVRLAEALNGEGPGAITSSVYWYDGRRFVLIPAEVRHDTVEIFPPADFVRMLQDLRH